MNRQNPNLVKAMSWVAENKHKYKRNIYDPMIFEVIFTIPGPAF